MKRAIPIALLSLVAIFALACGSDDSACEDLLERCETCFDPEQIAVCEARRADRDQVRCSLALDDVRALCGADAGPMTTDAIASDARVVDALPSPADMPALDARPMLRSDGIQ
ncbi:MAG: hypothetical protein ACI9U2_002318 [Bradymonadia bacterium]